MLIRSYQKIQKHFESLINFYPRYCLLCFKKTENVCLVCRRCLTLLPYVKQACPMCGLKMTGNIILCGQCLKKVKAFDQTIIPFYYEKPITTLLFQLKFYDQLACLSFFSYFLVAKLKQRIGPLPEVIIPVPLHKNRLKMRGYNQSLELAKKLSRLLNIRLDRHCCRRVKITIPQQGLNVKERRKNVKNAFSVKRKLIYQHIALVDDVMTTGATVNEVAKCLKEKGASTVEVWCCARA